MFLPIYSKAYCRINYRAGLQFNRSRFFEASPAIYTTTYCYALFLPEYKRRWGPSRGLHCWFEYTAQNSSRIRFAYCRIGPFFNSCCKSCNNLEVPKLLLTDSSGDLNLGLNLGMRDWSSGYLNVWIFNSQGLNQSIPKCMETEVLGI